MKQAENNEKTNLLKSMKKWNKLKTMKKLTGWKQ